MNFKVFFILILLPLFYGCNDVMNIKDFNRIVDFILQNGDRAAYSNMYNHNPHFKFRDFDAYLNPDAGQGNINCDPLMSSFDEIVICHDNDIIRYYHVKNKNNKLIYDRKESEMTAQYFNIIFAEIDKT